MYLFTANTPTNGSELWRTDGTAAGTTLVKDIRPGPDNSVAGGLTRVGNRVVFFADDGVHGIEPWASDGTAAGTQMVADVVPGPGGMSNGTASLAALGAGRFVFSARVGSAWELWVSDFTAAGTNSIWQFAYSPVSGPRMLAPLGSQVLFEAQTGSSSVTTTIWATDGTAAGTIVLGPSTAVTYLQLAGGFAYFRGHTAATGWELWKTDGTIAGTGMVVELMPGGGFAGDGNPWLVGELPGGDVLLFATAPTGRHLFRSDGTAAGTTFVSNAAPSGTFYGSDWGTTINGFVHYTVPYGPQAGFYRTDGTPAGTTLLAAVDAGKPGHIGNDLFFAGDDGSVVGRELWTSDGTPGGTQLLVDLAAAPINLGSWPVILGTFRDRVVVHAEEAATGRELWLTDGTAAGTQLLADLEPGPGGLALEGLASNDERMLFFAVSAAHDGDPWLSDGTSAGTAQLDILPASSGFRGIGPAAFGDRFVFSGFLPGLGHEPWITDGTVAGTQLLADVRPGALNGSPRFRLRLGNLMMFEATGGASRELWRTDGTPTGTVKVADIDGSGSPWFGFHAVALGGEAYFARWTPAAGVELWRTDGMVVTLCSDLEPGATSSLPFGMTPVAGRLLYQATVGGQPRLVVTDGTAAGTTLLSITAVEFRGPYPIDDNHAGFFVPATNGQPELWRTDGTDTGTVFVRSFAGTTVAPESRKLGVDRLLMTLDDGQSGYELWSIDGTAAGTFPVFDMAPTDAWPRYLRRAGEHVVFTADDGVVGNELFAVPLHQTDDWAVAEYGSGCPGTGGATPAISLVGVARAGAAQPFALLLDGALANTFAALAWSTTRGAAAIPGCTVWLGGAPLFVPTPTDNMGRGGLAIAASTSVIGVRLTAQFFALDPAGVAFGLASATGAIEFVIGP